MRGLSGHFKDLGTQSWPSNFVRRTLHQTLTIGEGRGGRFTEFTHRRAPFGRSCFGSTKKTINIKHLPVQIAIAVVIYYCRSDVLSDLWCLSMVGSFGLLGAKKKKKTINRKHINIFLTALAGQSSQGRTPTRPRDKRDKMAILLWN